MFREKQYPINIPTWENDEWSYTTFHTMEEFKYFVLSLFLEPGKYNFDEVSHRQFNAEAQSFNKKGYYCAAPNRSRDFREYWNAEKEKCRMGAIYKNGSKTWYIPRDYYMWLNFLPIFDKEEGLYDFPKIWDIQYHMALYEILAELHYRHAAILKKRQMASSYYHCGKIINQYWFESGAKLKMGASLKDYINEKGSWKMLQEYSDFLNKHTAWVRHHNPSKVGDWEQKISENRDGVEVNVGLMSTISGLTFEKEATKGVGGPCRIFFHEEGGIAPRAGDTYEYMRPALHSGMITTGLFIIAGSVGDLSQCEPLKEFMLKPEENGFYAVKSNLIDDKGTIGTHGLFLPEQWSMPPYIDNFGNSLVEEALVAIYEQRAEWKKNLTPEKYQLRVSQKPINIKEAFAYRDEAVFPLHILSAQEDRIDRKFYPNEVLDIRLGANGKAEFIKTTKSPISQFPVSSSDADKEGAIVVWERPSKDPRFGEYYASIDPVGEGKAEYVDNLVYTLNGKKRIGDIRIGDKVIGSNGKPTMVTGVYPQGQKELYRVTFNDGYSILVCKEHLWSVRSNGGERYDNHILSVGDLIDRDKVLTFKGIGRNREKEYSTATYFLNNKGNCKWRIPIVQPIQFSKRSLGIDPYLLGLLLGDGGISTRSIRFSSADKEIIDSISKILPEDITIKKIGKYDYRISTEKTRNSITKELRTLGLMGRKSIDKFVPEDYMYSSIQDRLSIIQGLLDTDGYCGNHGVEYYSISDDLANNMVSLVQSLGGIARKRKKITNGKENNGVGYIYVVRVNLPPQFKPFRLKRKLNIYKPSNVFSRYISNIQVEKVGEAVCISVEAKDSLYVTENAIVTHNTTTSHSLCAIYIYKNSVQVTRLNENNEPETFIEPGKIVASWCGRFDDINKTNERMELLIEMYNAWTIVENNISIFITHMQHKKKQKYLVLKDQIVFLKELNSNANVFSPYGWKNTGELFKKHMISYAIEFIREAIDEEFDENGNVISNTLGIERIPDPMLIREMRDYREGLNVDRLVAFAALVSFVKVQDATRGYQKRVEDDVPKLENSENLFKLKASPFKHMGGQKQSHTNGKFFKSPFKNIK